MIQSIPACARDTQILVSFIHRYSNNRYSNTRDSQRHD